jgi:formate dehydrogenase maturation protein FdhE
MNKKKLTWAQLEAKLSDIEKVKKSDTAQCPICGISRNKGNHQKCSKITQLKHRQERG